MNDDPVASIPDRAAELFAPALLSLIEATRAASARVVASAGAEAARDDDAVHDLRVALRRLRTLLGPAREVYRKKKLRRVIRDLGRVGRAAGALRDEEVLLDTLSGLELPDATATELAAWMTHRASKERLLRTRLAERLRPPEGDGGRSTLDAALHRLESRVNSGKARDADARALAARALDRAVERVRALAGAGVEDAAMMHALRIRYKRLRYTAELFAPIVGERASQLARGAARMQKRLGDLHDFDEAVSQVERTRRLSDAARQALRDTLRVARAHAQARVIEGLAEGENILAEGLGAEPTQAVNEVTTRDASNSKANEG